MTIVFFFGYAELTGMILSSEPSVHSSMSKSIGIFVFLFLVLSLPLTIHLLQSSQSTQQYANVKCIPRPACLDATISCKIPEPKNGWCPPSSTPSMLTPTVLVTQAVASATALPARISCIPLPSCYYSKTNACSLHVGITYCSPTSAK